MTVGGKPVWTNDSYRQATFSSSSFICYPNVVFLPLPSPSTSSRKFNKYRSWLYPVTRQPRASAPPHGTLLLFLSLPFSAVPHWCLSPLGLWAHWPSHAMLLCYISLRAAVQGENKCTLTIPGSSLWPPHPRSWMCNRFDGHLVVIRGEVSAGRRKFQWIFSLASPIL